MIDIGGFKFNNLDRVLIIDREFTVVYNSGLDSRLIKYDVGKTEVQSYINRNLFELYPSLTKKTSSVVRCITTGEIVIKRFQKIVDFQRRSYYTHNITIPIMRNGKIIGAMELVKDVTTVDDVDNVDNMDSNKHEGDQEDNVAIDKLINTFGRDPGDVSFDDFITEDITMLKVIEQAKSMAKVKSPTLIYGESGTGKEVLVQSMINYSGISRKKVIIQNCAALPSNLIESILFGTHKGVYTGAENRRGLFEEADHGLIFLDEINSIPYDVQGKLLRVVQDGTFRSLGSNVEKSINVKIIAAMNIDPIKAIEEKQLRGDLFYRLSAGMIFIPPLRDRKRDIGLFVRHYINEYNMIYGKNVKGISKELEKFFLEYNWNGNVRELKHIIESMIGISEESILNIRQLPAYLYGRVYKTEEKQDAFMSEKLPYDIESLDLNKILSEKETEVIKYALKIAGGSKTIAGKILGIPRQTLNYKMNRLGIKRIGIQK